MVVEEEVGGGFRGREGGRNDSFTLLDIFVACNTHPRRADPAQILLLWLKYYISYLRCILQITMVRVCKIGLEAYSPNLKAIQWLMNP